MRKNAKGEITSISSEPFQTDDEIRNIGSIYDFEYEVMVEPEKLEGIRLIWNIVAWASQSAVFEKGVDLLTKLFLNSHNSLSKELVIHIREGFLGSLLNHL